MRRVPMKSCGRPAWLDETFAPIGGSAATAVARETAIASRTVAGETRGFRRINISLVGHFLCGTALFERIRPRQWHADLNDTPAWAAPDGRNAGAS